MAYAGTPHLHMSRRSFLTGVGATAAVASAGTLGIAGRAEAAQGLFNSAVPKPIATLIGPTGAPEPFDFIHWTLPGTVGATTPINLLEAFGLDAHRSTVGDYEGFTTYAVVAGTAHSSQGPLDVELDIRVMHGRFVAEDGKVHHGTFGFF